MKKVNINGEWIGIIGFRVDFNPSEKDGMSGVTIFFDRPMNGKKYAQYLKDDIVFKRTFGKVKFRKLLGDYLSEAFPKNEIADNERQIENEET